MVTEDDIIIACSKISIADTMLDATVIDFMKEASLEKIRHLQKKRCPINSAIMQDLCFYRGIKCTICLDANKIF